ncbi:Metallophosphoesterase [Nostocoides japonicum T1-X7]|uniref:Metallophosphoesterase n=1 Tax=Nostocoides japonicum T1-X7 TaxID=1194083 RepID=A0A077LZX2_9MICO|nr:metallophosphoesterase [Tetrasphaera japonica]CCH78422.1 Metallophosphoesterase [Tetrasphaera japonica T1-X7]
MTSPPLSRVAVIGDVGGHTGALRRELRRLGADPVEGTLPPGLLVVQVGDLVHRGPDSDGVVALVDRYLRTQPDQWVQLVGNHEAQYLREPVFDWPDEVADATAETIRRWWGDGLMRVGVALPTPDGDFLVTHAGLTAGMWRAVLDTPIDARRAARRLNGLVGRRDAAVFRAGAMLGRRASGSAGPLWAEAASELVPSWFQTRIPFHQVHGHSTLVDWATGRFRGSAQIEDLTTVDPVARHETTRLDGGVIIGIDPDHGVEPTARWRSLEIPLAGPATT